MEGNGMKKMMSGDGTIAYAGVAGAVGGLLGFAGVYLKWFQYGYPVSGGSFTQYLNGTDDWTGQVAFIAGLGAFAFGAAYVLLSDPQIRKLTAGLMGIGAIFLLAMTLIAFTRVEDAIGTPVLLGVAPGSSVEVTRDVAGGLWASLVGGVVGVYGAFLAVRSSSS
jgi:hypothetical protein